MSFKKHRVLLLVSLLFLLILSSSCSRRDTSHREQEGLNTPTPSAAPSPSPSPAPTKVPEDEKGADWSTSGKGSPIEITRNGITCEVNSASGLVTRIASGERSVAMDGIVIDVGIQEAFAFSQLGYSSYEDLATWELPLVWAKLKPLPAYEVLGIEETETGFTVSLSIASLTVEYHYEMLENALKVYGVITTKETSRKLVNGVGFLVKGYQSFDKEKTTAEFPGSTPQGKIPLSKYPKYSVVSTDYSCPIIQFDQEGSSVNALFVDEEEKWTASFYSDENDKPCSVFLAAVEGYLTAGEQMQVGAMYLQLPDEEKDAYLAIQDLWTELGYRVPDNGVNDGPVYSAHPYGTMDTSYFNRLTLQEYADQLEQIAAMGFKNVWLLPIFYHTGDNVYEPIDQGVIDKRYGGEEGAQVFINRAHELNLRVLFDLVPHGPRPVYPFAKEHDDWISKKKDGSNQIEWGCVSFDYNNPGYYNYTKELISYYARDFGLDGARIDCSMGGLSNWQPVEGLRPSSSGLAAGINITKAIREGFIEADVNPILLPENFHPNPAFAQYTDVFYDMPLYRTMHNLHHARISETEYVQTLQHWLEAEQKTSVKGQVKLRFLGNHDTVTWTFDAQRAQTLYGVKRAKALWSILSLIDGVPFIYQGDEDPAAYRLEGENLEQFFTDLLKARSQYTPADYSITYLYSDTPVFAFTRADGSGSNTRLVLINVSESANSFPLEEGLEILYTDGAYTLEDGHILLEPYSTVIIEK
ncbi:glycosidase [Anaerotaenia torta]|uniref:alpha-amylase family glycosyl hydrolase n=1 Tax=Anaerotaenia torta TaxID=433293 RepID=UPI003D2461BC